MFNLSSLEKSTELLLKKTEEILKNTGSLGSYTVDSFSSHSLESATPDLVKQKEQIQNAVIQYLEALEQFADNEKGIQVEKIKVSVPLESSVDFLKVDQIVQATLNQVSGRFSQASVNLAKNILDVQEDYLTSLSNIHEEYHALKDPLKEAIPDLKWEDVAILARNIQKNQISTLSEKEKMFFFLIAKRKNSLEALLEKIPSSEKEIKEELTSLLAAIQSPSVTTAIHPFIEFSQAYANLANNLSSHELSFRALSRLGKKIDEALLGSLPESLDKLGAQKELALIQQFAKSIVALAKMKEQIPDSHLWISSEQLSELGNTCSKLIEMSSQVSKSAENALRAYQIKNKFSIDDLAQLEETARKLATFSKSYPDPALATNAQTIFYHVASEYLRYGKIKKAFEILAQAATMAWFPTTHVLHSGAAKIKELCSHNPLPQMGAFINELDSDGVKEQAIKGSMKNIEGKETLCFAVKFNQQRRESFEQWMQMIEDHPDLLQKNLPSELCKNVSISKVSPYVIRGENEKGVFSSNPSDGLTLMGSKAIQIEFSGIGKVTIVRDPDFKSIKNQVIVEMNPELPAGQTLKKLHGMLTMIGCGPVVTQGREEDQSRRAILHLFREFYPREAFSLEKDPGTFQLSVNELKDKVIALVPDMKDKFTQFLSENNDAPMKVTFGGKLVPAFEISPILKSQKVYGFMVGMRHPSVKICADRLLLILERGIWSTQQRFDAGVMITGDSWLQDFESGGAETAFVRMINERLASDLPIDKFPLIGPIQILVKAEAVDVAGFYCAQADSWGTRKGAPYANRPSIFELADFLNTPQAPDQKETGKANEVSIRDGIPPEMIAKVVVQSEASKEALLQVVRQSKHLEIKNGEEYIFGRKLKDLVVVSKQFTKEMWNG